MLAFRRALHATTRRTRGISGLRRYVDVAPEISDALQRGAPVVALETALVTDGMPYPKNLDIANRCEQLVKSQGGVPATIAVIDGRVKVGLTQSELQRLAEPRTGTGVTKVSRRDFAAAIGLKQTGGTTIAGTMVAAHLAGIRVFATGGLGGVHRNGQHTMDVSADLTELGRTPVAVIASGIKSILDIPRTLEYLETQGVPVFTYGPDKTFPAFYARDSGCKSPWNVNSPVDAARVLYAQFNDLSIDTGLFFAAPVPEHAAANGTFIQGAIDQAVKESEDNGIALRGKDATPWLLARVAELTEGKSLASNIAAIENTSVIGTQIAVEYAKLQTELDKGPKISVYIPSHAQDQLPYHSSDGTISQPVPALAPDGGIAPRKPADLVVVGCAAVDIIAQQATSIDASGSTAPGTIRTALGGVGRNVAEAAHRLAPSGSSVLLVAPIGNDTFGRTLQAESSAMGMRTDGFIKLAEAEGRTPVCNMLLDISGELVQGVADMDAPANLGASEIIALLGASKPRLVALDANLSSQTIAALLDHCRAQDISTFFESTSVAKVTAILPALKAWTDISETTVDTKPAATFLAANVRELITLATTARSDQWNLLSSTRWWHALDALQLDGAFRQSLSLFALRPAEDVEGGKKSSLEFLTRDGVIQSTISFLPFFSHQLIQLGDRGVLAVFNLAGSDARQSSWQKETSNIGRRQIVSHAYDADGLVSGTTVVRHFPAIQLDVANVVNVTGAGDTLVGSVLAGLMAERGAFLTPSSLEKLVMGGQRAAVETLRSQYAVAPSLSRQ